MRRGAGLALALLLLASRGRVGATQTEAAPSPALKAALQAYHDSASKLRWAVSDERLADLYERAMVFATHPQVASDLAAFLEEASDIQRETLKETLMGVVLPGVGPVGPDRSFFKARCTKDRTPESREFFALLDRLHPSDPTATAQSKATASCSRLGDGSLAGVLRRLETARISVPYYRKVLQDERSQVIQEMTTGDCICGDRGAAEAEIARWLKAHSDDPARPALEKRVKELGSNPQVRFRCSSSAR
jgi:hypothetical protein